MVSMEIFIDIILPTALMDMGSTHPLKELSTTNIIWGVKAAGDLGWQPYYIRVQIVMKSGSLNLMEP